MYIFNLMCKCASCLKPASCTVHCDLLLLFYDINLQAQVEQHVLRNTQLSELLHMVNEKPITLRDKIVNLEESSSSRNYYSPTQSSRILPFLGPAMQLDLRTGNGLPKHISAAETAIILRVIMTNTSTSLYGDQMAQLWNPAATILWNPPIHAGKAMITTLRNRQLPKGHDERHVRVILRAMPFFHNKPGHDNVKVAVETDRRVTIYFAKCIVFFKDSREECFVLVQWYDKVGDEPFDSVSGLEQVVLRPANELKSYSLMPLTSIVNGALIVESEKKRWVLFSPREADAYKRTYNK